jgi:hypothetical protein
MPHFPQNPAPAGKSEEQKRAEQYERVQEAEAAMISPFEMSVAQWNSQKDTRMNGLANTVIPQYPTRLGKDGAVYPPPKETETRSNQGREEATGAAGVGSGSGSASEGTVANTYAGK